MNTNHIAASILSADFARLGEEVEAILVAGADRVHFDVMDNHYVPNLTIGPLVCRALRDYGITAPIDVHLMVQPVDRLIEDFAQAGATAITIHPEASLHIDRSVQRIRDLGCRAGLAFNPGTALACLPYLLDRLDRVLIMSVNPGFAGQQFLPGALKKLAEVRALLDQQGHTGRLEVDGGVSADNIADIARAGADTFVAGSAVFGQKDYSKAVMSLAALLSS